MVLYINTDLPANGSLVKSDSGPTLTKAPDPIYSGEVIPIRVVRVNNAGDITATTGFTCNLAIGDPGSTPIFTVEDMTAETGPAGWEEYVDFSVAAVTTWLGSATDPKETHLAVATYETAASDAKRVILQIPIKIYPKVL